MKTIPGFHPSGALRASKFAPGEFVEPRFASLHRGSHRDLHQSDAKNPPWKAGFLHLAVVAVWGELVSA
jgi:hypothetical protein